MGGIEVTVDLTLVGRMDQPILRQSSCRFSFHADRPLIGPAALIRVGCAGFKEQFVLSQLQPALLGPGGAEHDARIAL